MMSWHQKLERLVTAFLRADNHDIGLVMQDPSTFMKDLSDLTKTEDPEVQVSHRLITQSLLGVDRKSDSTVCGISARDSYSLLWRRPRAGARAA